MQIRICIDVDDIEQGIEFYTRALGLSLGRRFDGAFVELLGGTSPIDLIEAREATKANKVSEEARDYGRHWTPVHLDFVVTDLENALARAINAGAILEGEIRTEPYGRIANLGDPFGHGICLLEMNEQGYDAYLK